MVFGFFLSIDGLRLRVDLLFVVVFLVVLDDVVLRLITTFGFGFNTIFGFGFGGPIALGFGFELSLGFGLGFGLGLGFVLLLGANVCVMVEVQQRRGMLRVIVD